MSGRIWGDGTYSDTGSCDQTSLISGSLRSLEHGTARVAIIVNCDCAVIALARPMIHLY